jgi:hypothetical protein
LLISFVFESGFTNPGFAGPVASTSSSAGVGFDELNARFERLRQHNP